MYVYSIYYFNGGNYSFTRLIVGSSIGTTAAIVPLIIASIPLIARLVETSLREVPYGLIEAALSMGATPYQIISVYYFQKLCQVLWHS